MRSQALADQRSPHYQHSPTKALVLLTFLTHDSSVVAARVRMRVYTAT